jgi:tellurite resistance protein TerC
MSGNVPAWAWIAFGVTIVALLAVDLFVHRGGRHGSRKAAISWSIVWIAAGLGFNAVVWAVMGSRAGQEYLAAYLIEKSLSVDNLFVFLIIFRSLNIAQENQRTVLIWGIYGALIFRAIFVFVGLAALETWAWVGYVFGGILLIAAWRAFREDPTERKESRLVGWLSRHLPVTRTMRDHHFFVKEQGRRVATPLLVAIVAIELTDIMFAIDSVPAAFSVSHDRFIVLTSNAFAILGLRALYMVLAQTLNNLHYLHYGLAAVLAFAGLKMVTHELIEIPPYASIAIIVVIIGVSVWASLRADRLLAKRRRGGRASARTA